MIKETDRSYKNAAEYLYRQLPMFQRIGPKAFKKDLRNIIALCGALNDPQKAFRSVHIAGTNGKGSTAHIMASILSASGYRTGLYTSPHYKDFRERIRINGTPIEKEAVVTFVDAVRSLDLDIEPSFFEITVAMAFTYFAEKRVDIAIIETGLGGRLDSTNIVKPELSIITNIGYDHMDFLGDTLDKIAAEKAGIIKENVPVVIGQYLDETWPVFMKFATERNARIYLAPDILEVHKKAGGLSETTYRVRFREEDRKQDIMLDLAGDYQSENLRTALVGIDILRNKLSFDITDDSIVEGCANVRRSTGMTGRWQVLREKPLIIADAAHNVDGVKKSLQQLNEIKKGDLHIVWGTVSDKPLDKMLALLPKNAKYYFAKADIPRGMAADKLQALANDHGIKGFAYPSVFSALESAQKAAGPGDTIFIGGSIFTVAEVL
jgi:dihydrofolate synthase/folylpolyglutamate synthase